MSTNINKIEEVLDIYNYDFLGKTNDFIHQVLRADQDIQDKVTNTNIILPHKDLVDKLDIPNKKFSINNILTHLRFRHPIHIHGPRYEEINMNLMEKNIGYNKRQADAVDQWTDSSMRYGILGWTPVLKTNDSVAPESYILHTWGVNLERQDTTDYKYVFNSGRFDINRYFDLMALMFSIVENAAKYVNKDSNRPVVLRITNLGLGVWVELVPAEFLERIKKKYVDHLMEITSRNPWLVIYHADYTKNKTTRILAGKLNSEMPGADPFGSQNFENFNYNSLLIINAWDDRSFIGNGGTHDNSMDGWIISQPVESPFFHKNYNGKQLGSNFINASFLHNFVFYN